MNKEGHDDANCCTDLCSLAPRSYLSPLILTPGILHTTLTPTQIPYPLTRNASVNSEGHEPEADPYYFVFEFGRRICPGRILADANLYISIAQCIAAAFTIIKPVQDGKQVDLRAELRAGAISNSAPYKVNITPRTPRYDEHIQAVGDGISVGEESCRGAWGFDSGFQDFLSFFFLTWFAILSCYLMDSLERHRGPFVVVVVIGIC